jgi:hypothetical protein
VVWVEPLPWGGLGFPTGGTSQLSLVGPWTVPWRLSSSVGSGLVEEHQGNGLGSSFQGVHVRVHVCAYLCFLAEDLMLERIQMETGDVQDCPLLMDL